MKFSSYAISFFFGLGSRDEQRTKTVQQQWQTAGEKNPIETKKIITIEKERERESADEKTNQVFFQYICLHAFKFNF